MRILVAPTFFAINLCFGAAAMAQADHSMHGTNMGATITVAAKASPDTALGEALVKKVDKAKGTATLSHGALPNGMPPMTMAYKIKDTAWLDKLQAGQKIRFATDPADGGMTVTRIEWVK